MTFQNQIAVVFIFLLFINLLPGSMHAQSGVNSKDHQSEISFDNKNFENKKINYLMAKLNSKHSQSSEIKYRVSKMALDSHENVYFSGYTDSKDLPLINAQFNNYSGNTDGFLVKFTANGEPVFSTYIGGKWQDYIRNMAIDSTGNIFLLGYTSSPDFPTNGAPFEKVSLNSAGGFLSKLSPSGTLIFSRYIGPSFLGERPRSKIIIDGEENVYISREIYYKNFPTKNAYFDTYSGGGEDGLLLKYANNGTLLFSTYFGGSGREAIFDMQIDSKSNVYLSGTTFSVNFPTKNAIQPEFNFIDRIWGDGFIIKFSSNGKLLFSTYLGGSSTDEIKYMTIDDKDNVIVAGETSSSDFITKNAYFNSTLDKNDLFLANIAPNGSLLFSTYLGGSSWDVVSSLVVDSKENIYIAGLTGSFDFPVDNTSIFKIYGGTDEGFVTKFSSNGDLLFSTSIGGSGDDSVDDMDIDNQDNVYLIGQTRSNDFPMKSAILPIKLNASDFDGFLVKLSPNGSLLFSTFLGGSSVDFISSVIVSSRSNTSTIYLSGLTLSEDFPVKNTFYDRYNGSNFELFLAKFNSNGTLLFSTFVTGVIYLESPLHFLIRTVIEFIPLEAIVFSLLWIFLRIRRYKRKIKAPSYYKTFLVWKSGFRDYRRYKVAKQKGISSMKEFQQLEYYKAPNSGVVKKIKHGNFKDYSQFLKAKHFGASTLRELKLVERYKAPDYETAYLIQTGGFPSYETYKKAVEKGYVTFEDFLNNANQETI